MANEYLNSFVDGYNEINDRYRANPENTYLDPEINASVYSNKGDDASATSTKEWLKNNLLAKGALNEISEKAMVYLSSADFKYTDSSLGGNFAINPIPQFTRTADIRRRGLRKDFPYTGENYIRSEGMGRVYSERFDDNQQLIYIRFGVASFNTLASFIRGFYNKSAGLAARTGRANGFFYNVGAFIGEVVKGYFWPVMALSLVGKAIAFFTEANTTRFYRLKPTMPVYWQTVQNIVNLIATNLNITPYIFSSDKNKSIVTGQTPLKSYQFESSDWDVVRSAIPHLFTSNGSIDVFAMANRAARIEQKQIERAEIKFGDSGTTQGNLDSLLNDVREIYFNSDTNSLGTADSNPSLESYLEKWYGVEEFSSPMGMEIREEGGTVKTDTEAIRSIAGGTPDNPQPVKDSVLNFFKSELREGAAFAVFRVNYTGSVSESVSNSVGESDIQSKINNFAEKSKSTMFSLMGGNVGGGIGQAIGAIKETVDGTLDTVGLSGAFNLFMGGAFVDVPLEWKNTSMQLTRATYTIDLVTPYNNPISKLMYQYIPLAMLMAGAFPKSTGAASFYSPFMCELYDQGRSQTKIGMITDLTIERGTGNLGFNFKQLPMGMRVTFSVTDMSNILSVPITMQTGVWNNLLKVGGNMVLGGWKGALFGGLNTAADSIFTDDNAFNDYIAAITGLSVADQIHTLKKFKLRVSRALKDWETNFSRARIASYLTDTVVGRFANNFVIEAATVRQQRAGWIMSP